MADQTLDQLSSRTPLSTDLLLVGDPSTGISGKSVVSDVINSGLPSQSGNSGKYLTTNGSNAAWATIVSASGTTNYIAKFTGSNSLGNSQIFDNGTNVGIGTATNLSDKLNIYEASAPIIRFQASANQYGARIGLWAGNHMQIHCASANLPIVFQTAGTINDNGYERMRIKHDGLIGINEGAPGAQLQVTTAAAATKGLIVKGASAQSANLQEWQNSSGTVLTTVTSAGFVKVGTSASQGFAMEVSKLADFSYSGTAYRVASFNAETSAAADRPGVQLGFDTTGAGIIAAATNSIGSDLAFWTYTGSAWGERLRITKAGNVGIGTASPNDGLHVYNKTIGIATPSTSNDTVAFRIYRNSSTTQQFAIKTSYGAAWNTEIDSSNSDLWLRTTNAGGTGGNLVINADKVGINASATPGAALHVVNTAAATKALIVRGASGQSASLQEWQSNNGTIVASVQPDGSIYGSYGSIYNSTSAASGAFIGVSKWIGQDGQYVNIRKLYGTRTIPTTVGGYVEIARMGRYGSAPVTITIHACSAQGLTGQAPKIYMFCTEGYYYGGGVIPPISSNVQAGGYGSFDFELEAVIDPTDANFLTYRIRRTVGTAQANCMFTIEIHNFNSSALLEASNTGTSTSPLSYLRTNNRFTNVTTPPPAGGSGAGVNLSVSAGSAVGTGSGGSVILYSGAGAGGGTTGLFQLRNSYDSSNRRNISMLVRSIPDTVGNYVEVGRVGWGSGALLKATVFASRGAYDALLATYNPLCKVYEFYPHYYTSGIVAPRTISGTSGGARQPNEFELELAFDSANNSQTIRLRRTKADATNFNNYTAVVIIEQDIWSPHAMEFTELSGTGTSAYGSGYLTNTGNYCSPALVPPPPSGTSGAGTDLALYGQNAIGTGNGGNILLQAGAFVTSGSNGKVIVRGLASNTANLQEWQNNAGTALSAVKSDGSIQPASLADSAATNNSIYYSTTAGKLVYKDSSGTVNNLY